MNSTHSTGESAFAAAVKTGRWANPEVLERLAEAHQQQRTELWEAANRSLDHHRPRLAEALVGDAGEAMLKAHDENARLWFRHADTYATSGGALVDAISELRGLNIDLDLLIQEKEPAYNAALKRGNVVGAEDILTSSLAEADGMVTDRGARATKFVQAIDFTMPLPERPASSGQSKSPDHDKQTEKPQKPTKSSGSDGTNGTSDETSPAELKHDKQSDVPAASEAGPNSPVPSALSGHDKETAPSEPASSLPATSMMSRGNSAGGGSGSSGGVGSGMSGLGSSLKPPSGLGSPRGGMPASGAMPSSGGLPGGASTSPASASPLANAGSSFQSGLASGMSATGGGSSAPVSPVSQSLSQQQAAAAASYAAQPPAGAMSPVGSAPAGVSMGGGPAGADMGGAAQGGAPMGGGGMMPPGGAMAGGPLAPYSAPGAGAGGATPAASSTATSPASGGTSGSGGAPAGPLMAAGHATNGAASGLAASAASEVNPDLLLAQRMVASLVRACENWPSLIVWAVSVVKTPVGPQIIIATGSGGGGYVPPTVVLPTTARLAVVDPALPFGWATRWMGCQKPSKILADHFDLFRKKTAGAQLSAMVTTEVFAQAPEGVQDFLAVQHRDALAMAIESPRLDGGHQHRLAAFDPGLAHRIAAFDRDPQMSLGAAWNVTAAVVDAAHVEPDASGDKLATDDEFAVLRAVHRGAADTVGWNLYDSLADKRHGGVLAWPEIHAPEDFDGSKLNHDMAFVYRKYFRMGRIVELVRCWKFSPPPLADVVYCGIHAGFGSTVVAKISELEQYLGGGQS